jgi:hypothetical protein
VALMQVPLFSLSSISTVAPFAVVYSPSSPFSYFQHSFSWSVAFTSITLVHFCNCVNSTTQLFCHALLNHPFGLGRRRHCCSIVSFIHWKSRNGISNIISSGRRQSNSSDVSSSQGINKSKNSDLSGLDNNLDLNNDLNLNGLDLSNLSVNELDLNNINVNKILDQLQEQLFLESGLSGNSFNEINELDLSNLNDLQLNNFDLNQFNNLFDSQFSVQSIVQLLEVIDSSNVLDFSNNENIDLNSFANSFNEQFQSSWQANEILALLLSSSGVQDLQQLADLAQLSGLNNNEILSNSLINSDDLELVETQIEEISI